jgi:hypothetical protein
MTLQVMGVGLGRTGTMSLTLALERLGFGPCLHNTTPELVPLWLRAAQGNPDWDRLFAGYKAVTDYPACNFWRELGEYYPHLKFVLTIRDADDWFRSTQETIFSAEAIEQFGASPAAELFEMGIWRGIKEHIHDRDFMVKHFERHVSAVQGAIPADRLLTYKVAEGWEPLCRFLEVAIPEEPFPRVNTSDDTKALLERLWRHLAITRH